MKKLLQKVLLISLCIIPLIMLTACGKYTGKIANNNVTEFEQSGLSFFVSNNATYKDTLLTAINETIDELGMQKIQELINYHSDLLDGKSPNLSFSLPNLNDNTDGNIVIYSSVDGPPFDYIGKNNQVMGMEIDVLKFVAEKLNKKIITRTCVFGAIVQNITASTDEWRMSGVGVRVTEERKEKVAFSNSYWTMKLNIISKQKDNYSSITQISGKKVGVYTGESGEVFVKEKISDGTISSKTSVVEYTSPQSAFQAFLAGKVDAVVTLDYVADALVKNR